MMFNVISHKLDIGNKYAQTSYPVKDTLKTTENEYREFLSTFGYSLNQMKNYFNQVILPKGLHFPYSVDEIETDVKFKEGSMHVFMQMEQNADKVLEEEFWDKDTKEKHHLDQHDDAEWDWIDGESWEEKDEEVEQEEDKEAAQARTKKDHPKKK